MDASIAPGEPPAAAPPISIRNFVDLLMDMGRALVECGCSSNRIEHLNTMLGEAYGYRVETMALPTGVWVSVRGHGKRMVELVRIQTWTVNLDRLDQISLLVDRIAEERLSIMKARAALNVILAAPRPYAFPVSLLAGGGASAVIVYLYRGNWQEMGVVFPLGLIVELFDQKLFQMGPKKFLVDFLSAVFVACYASFCQHLLPGLDVPRLVVGGLISRLPGLIMVNAVHEIAQKNLVSGSAKLLEALTIVASLGCGVFFAFAILGLVGR